MRDDLNNEGVGQMHYAYFKADRPGWKCIKFGHAVCAWLRQPPAQYDPSSSWTHTLGLGSQIPMTVKPPVVGFKLRLLLIVLVVCWSRGVFKLRFRDGSAALTLPCVRVKRASPQG